MELSHYLVTISMFLTLLLLHEEGLVLAAHGRYKKAMFVFGGSLFDPGNNQYLNTSSKQGIAVTWPYGLNYFHRPTGRLSDGRIVPDFIAQFARLPILPPYLEPGTKLLTLGANFASAGAAVLGKTHPGTMSLREQLRYFKEVEGKLKIQLGADATKRLLMDAVYLFSMGGNDYFNFYMRHSKAAAAATQPEKRAFVAQVTGNLSQVLQEIYDIGGRKMGFQNAGPLGCHPSMKAMNGINSSRCISKLSELARLHNRALARVLQKLEKKNKGFKYSIFDYYEALSQRINSPAKFGFKNGDDACCGPTNCGKNGSTVCRNPNEYIWFDGGHTTQRANYQFAQLIWAGKPNVTGPFNFRQFYI